MNQYILNFLPRIIENGKKLNQIEAIVDKVWIKYDVVDYESYRFRRDNSVLVSIGGFVEEKKWEIQSPNGLYISKDGRGVMYKQAVVFDSIMLVQQESRNYQPVIFYDETKIPDGNVEKYLTKMFEKKPINLPINSPKIVEKIQTTGGILVIKRDYYNASLIDSDVYINFVVAHAVRHVRAAACRTTNKFGSPNQQQEIKNIVNKKQQWHNTILEYATMKDLR